MLLLSFWQKVWNPNPHKGLLQMVLCGNLHTFLVLWLSYCGPPSPSVFKAQFHRFWGAASVHFLLLNFLAGFYCTLSYKLSSAPLTLSSPVSPLLCAHTQKIHLLFSNEKKLFLDLISIEGGRPIVNKTLEPLLYCSPAYDFIWLSFLPFRIN